jgi:hypothetical protein
MKTKKKRREFISAEELVGKIHTPSRMDDKRNEPVFISDGSGNGHLMYPHGQITYVYFR